MKVFEMKTVYLIKCKTWILPIGVKKFMFLQLSCFKKQ